MKFSALFNIAFCVQWSFWEINCGAKAEIIFLYSQRHRFGQFNYPKQAQLEFFCEDNQGESGKSFLHNDHRKIVGVHFKILKLNLTAKEVQGKQQQQYRKYV